MTLKKLLVYVGFIPIVLYTGIAIAFLPMSNTIWDQVLLIVSSIATPICLRKPKIKWLGWCGVGILTIMHIVMAFLPGQKVPLTTAFLALYFLGFYVYYDHVMNKSSV